MRPTASVDGPRRPASLSQPQEEVIEDEMRVILVNMPWAAVDKPSLALGILRQAVLREFPGSEVTVIYANLEYVDWLADRRNFGLADYTYYSVASYFQGCGDWVFSSALYDDPEWRIDEFEKYMAGQADEDRIAEAVALHKIAPGFISSLAGQITALEPDVVGFTSTFQQNTAALAAAREVKRLSPNVTTVFGGANCDGEQGLALHRNFPFVDFVVRGEGDVAFPELLKRAVGDRDYAAIAGLCWRQSGGSTAANAIPRSPLPPSAMVAPEFDDYFASFAASRAHAWSEPQLVVESARGCWWGEKHHCTFCGLNGSFMQFRSKPPGVFVEELLTLVERHKILEVSVVDNIIDMNYLGSALPAIIEAGYDLRLHYEIKANMKKDQLRILRAAGVVNVQPGIESLSSKVLKIMDKGVTGCLNVRFLRDAESLGIQAWWNYLFGFPGEEDADYDRLIEQFPALHHLMPPVSVGELMVERFSPYFDRPELGFADLAVVPLYHVTYDLPERELFGLSYYFDAPHRGIGEDVARALREAAESWTRAYYDKSRLTQCDLGQEILLISTRPGFDWHHQSISDSAEAAAFRLLDQPHTAAGLTRKLTSAGFTITEEALSGVLARWKALGIVFADNGQFIHLATDAINQELQRWTPPGVARACQ
jgi:ribosomal peptide maturation radical SAM protein 1